MKKKILLGLTMAMVTMSVTACGNAKSDSTTAEAEVQVQEDSKGLKEMFDEKNNDSQTKKTENETETESEIETETEKETENPDEKKQTDDESVVSEDWEDMQFAMDGEFYALPMPFNVLEAEGWEIDTDVYDEGDEVEPGETKVVCIYNDDYDEDMSAFVMVTNYGKDTELLSNCLISNLEIDAIFGDEFIENVPEIVIAQGITWGSTADEVIEAFGEPDDTYDSEYFDYTSYMYESDDCSMELEIYDEFGVTSIEIETKNEESVVSSAHSSSSSVSTNSNSKKQDVDISDDWKDMEFIFDGEKYCLTDAPYATLEENGWSFELSDYGYEDGYILNPNDQISCTVYLENPDYDEDLDLSVGFVNGTKKAKDIKKCSIWAFDCCIDYGSEVLENVPDMTIAQGITWGSTAEEVFEAFGEPEDEYRSDVLEYTEYTYRDGYDKQLRIYVYDDYGVTEMELKLYN